MSGVQRVLLVEDDPLDQTLIQRAFERIGSAAEIQIVDTVAAATEVLGVRPHPVLVVVDLRLAGESGLTLVSWARDNESTSTVPFVVLSGSDDRTDVRAAYDAGANAYLVKPSSMEDFEDLVRRVDAFWLGACALVDDSPSG